MSDTERRRPIWRVAVTRTERDTFACEADTAAEAIERVKRMTEYLWRGHEDVRFAAEQVGETFTESAGGSLLHRPPTR